MLKRTLIVIAVALGIVFVPYLVGLFHFIDSVRWYEEREVHLTWLEGFLTLAIPVVLYILAAPVIINIYNYIKH